MPPSFIESNFGRNEYKDKIGRSLPAYLLTREAFSLLVMGFTGKAAIRWKLAYIEAFNALEEQASISREEHQRLLSLAREFGYHQGREETLALPATQELMERIRLEGVEEGRKIQKRQDGYAMTMKAIGYLQKGLSLAEAAKLCDMTKAALDTRLRRLRSGMASLRRAKPVQGNLLEAAS